MHHFIVGVLAISVVLHPRCVAFSVGPPQVKVAQFSLIVSIQAISFVVLLATVQSSKQIASRVKRWTASSLIKLLGSKW